MYRFKYRSIVSQLFFIGLIGISANAHASGFQLWEQDGATVGNYHAGYAAEANNASTAFYNPAGIVRIPNQQISASAIAVTTNMKYSGTINLNPSLGEPAANTTAQGGNFALLPALHYVAPLSERLSFGFSVDVPFGLKTNYGSTSLVRYADTQASVTVIDVSPTIAYRVTDKASIGAGPDIQRMFLELDNVGSFALSTPDLDTTSVNKMNDTAYGFHVGGLYEFTPDARVGLSYHSQVVHHLTGTSQFTGPLADYSEFSGPYSSHATSNSTLPAYTALSGFYKFDPQWALMGSAILTQWSVVDSIILNGISGVQDTFASQNLQVTIPQHFRNTWNLSVGANYYATDAITLRTGVGYDQTPVSDAYRNTGLPDNNRIVVALGTHMQASKALGFDLGWMHIFMQQASINPPPEVMGDQIVLANGHVEGGADVFSGQVTWDIF